MRRLTFLRLCIQLLIIIGLFISLFLDTYPRPWVPPSNYYDIITLKTAPAEIERLTLRKTWSCDINCCNHAYWEGAYKIVRGGNGRANRGARTRREWARKDLLWHLTVHQLGRFSSRTRSKMSQKLEQQKLKPGAKGEIGFSRGHSLNKSLKGCGFSSTAMGQKSIASSRNTLPNNQNSTISGKHSTTHTNTHQHTQMQPPQNHLPCHWVV